MPTAVADREKHVDRGAELGGDALLDALPRRFLSPRRAGVHEERRIGFRSLHESIDTTTSTGKLIFHVFGALAEFERDLIRERTNAGLTAARARGRKDGRRPVLDDKQRLLLQSLAHDRNKPR